LKELGDKVSDEEKQSIETSISDLDEALKGEDVESIKAKTEVLSQASAALAQKLYAEQGAADPGAAVDPAQAGSAESVHANDAVEGEFEEVDESKR